MSTIGDKVEVMPCGDDSMRVQSVGFASTRRQFLGLGVVAITAQVNAQTRRPKSPVVLPELETFKKSLMQYAYNRSVVAYAEPSLTLPNTTNLIAFAYSPEKQLYSYSQSVTVKPGKLGAKKSVPEWGDLQKEELTTGRQVEFYTKQFTVQYDGVYLTRQNNLPRRQPVLDNPFVTQIF